MMEITSFLRNGEQQFYDFNTPWSMAIIVLGFLCAWAVTTVLEHFGLTRHLWHLPLFFAALALLFRRLIGLFFAPRKSRFTALWSRLLLLPSRPVPPGFCTTSISRI